MNKKFSTLAVAAMLASAFTVNAAPGDVVTYLTKGNNGKAYQLVTRSGNAGSYEYQYLTLEEDGSLRLLTDNEIDRALNENAPSYTWGGTLWCVNVTLENDGKTIIYDFTNKAHGSILDLSVGGYATAGTTGSEWTKVDNVFYKDFDHVGGEVSGWAFAPVLGSSSAIPSESGDNGDFMFDTQKPGNASLNQYSLRSYINSNKVATLVWKDSEKKEGIQVAVVNADELNKVSTKEIQFFLKEADPITLNANEFNTVLFTQKDDFRKLTFDKDYNNTDIVNPFSTNELKAEAIEGDKDGFVRLYKKNADGTNSYLRVDTAYANDYGVNFLKFAFSSDDDKIAYNAENNPIAEQYKFRLNYCLTEDSLSIQVKEARYLQEGETWWNQVNTDGSYKALNENIDTYYWNAKEATPTDNKNVVDDGKYVHNWVKLQDLVASQEIRIVTVGKSPINTHISFGFGDCTAVQAEYTSVADGVYYIKNAKGQYLAHPIYNNGWSEPQFVTVNADEQEVAHMPAYQWVVLKEYTETAGAKEFSPVKIANREFNTDFVYRSVQLKKAEGATYMYASGNAIGSVTVDSLEFKAVPAASVKDQYLGYKKFDSDSLRVNKYTFNYWHPYASDKFIAQSSKDSTLTVLDGKDAFRISEINETIGYDKNDDAHVSAVDIEYGFGKNMSDADFAKIQKRIPGLAQLVRTAYEINLNGVDWKVNKNEQFNLGANYDMKDSPWTNDVQNVDHYFVFFKENNHIDGKDYYAIVRTMAYKPAIIDGDTKTDAEWSNIFNEPLYEYLIANNKAGVSDYDGAATLKAQVLEETRTSAFAIAADETPLYRRFNSAALEGQAGDGVDTLRFYEKYRKEYLMVEANPNFMVEHIDFLGIDAQDKAQGGLAFIVDTAWVNRGAGNLKPQYLISIDRHDFDGVAGEPCTEAGPHVDESGHITDDPYACVHAHKAVPGFKRGKFLINFHHFANNEKMVGSDDYKWAEYDRAGFKEAIIVKDTMYILRDEFKNLPNEEIDLAKIASAEVEAMRAWTNAGKADQNARNFLSYRYELTGDNHKYVTWSMRFFDRTVAANEVEADRAFLFESMKSLASRTTDPEDNANYVHGEEGVHKGKYNINSVDGDIAPEQAAWLKMQNGCLVLSDENSKFDEVATGADDALIFNVEHVDGDKVAVDNEEIAVEGVSVVAGNGQVTIMGAAGKNVTITNILGKVVASQVIASDNATIAVPAGIVAVAVEGEAAVKAIVK